MSERDQFDILAEENRARFAQAGETFYKNFLLGLDYTDLDKAKLAIEKENAGMVVRFDEEHIVTSDGTVLSGEKYAEINVLGAGVKHKMAGVAVYLKPKA